MPDTDRTPSMSANACSAFLAPAEPASTCIEQPLSITAMATPAAVVAAVSRGRRLPLDMAGA
ncbi:hypothetical protein BIU98_02385 [Curtobacterium sp. MMLR14_010]|nr:hypothetical protein BIU98_02385 [Curtobacterium sp. MMLR14_010]